MAFKQRTQRGFALFISVLVILLIGAIVLFVYGSMTNGIPQPHLPGEGHFAPWTTLRHG